MNDKSKANLRVVKKDDAEVVTVRQDVRYGMVPVGLIKPNPFQPRGIFKEEDLKMLAETIKIHGVNDEDVRVNDDEDGTFTLINGERRWRATQIAGLTHISAKIEKISRLELLERASLANLCVVPLNMVEQAYAFRNLMKERGWNQSELSRRTGKSQGTISNALKIFGLTKEIQALALCGKVAPGIALLLASFEENDQSILLSACKKEIELRGGRPLAPNELLRFIRKTAGELGIKSRAKKKKSRKELPHHSLLARSVVRLADKLKKEIKELAQIEHSDLSSMKDPPFLTVIGGLKELMSVVPEKIRTFEEILD